MILYYYSRTIVQWYQWWTYNGQHWHGDSDLCFNQLSSLLYCSGKMPKAQRVLRVCVIIEGYPILRKFNFRSVFFVLSFYEFDFFLLLFFDVKYFMKMLQKWKSRRIFGRKTLEHQHFFWHSKILNVIRQNVMSNECVIVFFGLVETVKLTWCVCRMMLETFFFIDKITAIKDKQNLLYRLGEDEIVKHG